MADKPKVACSVCHGLYNRNKDGTVRTHGDHTPGMWPPQNCRGSRLLPAPSTPGEEKQT